MKATRRCRARFKALVGELWISKCAEKILSRKEVIKIRWKSAMAVEEAIVTVTVKVVMEVILSDMTRIK